MDGHLDDFMQCFGNECLQYVSPAPFTLAALDGLRGGEGATCRLSDTELPAGSLHETIKTLGITSHSIWCVLMLS